MFQRAVANSCASSLACVTSCPMNLTLLVAMTAPMRMLRRQSSEFYDVQEPQRTLRTHGLTACTSCATCCNSSQQPCCRHSEHRTLWRTLRVHRALLYQEFDGFSGEKWAPAGVQGAMRICRRTWQLPTHEALRAGGLKRSKPYSTTGSAHVGKLCEGRGLHLTAGQLRACAFATLAVHKLIAGVADWPAFGRVDIESHQIRCKAVAGRTLTHAASATDLLGHLRCTPQVCTRAGTTCRHATARQHSSGFI